MWAWCLSADVIFTWIGTPVIQQFLLIVPNGTGGRWMALNGISLTENCNKIFYIWSWNRIVSYSEIPKHSIHIKFSSSVLLMGSAVHVLQMVG